MNESRCNDGFFWGFSDSLPRARIQLASWLFHSNESEVLRLEKHFDS